MIFLYIGIYLLVLFLSCFLLVPYLISKKVIFNGFITSFNHFTSSLGLQNPFNKSWFWIVMSLIWPVAIFAVPAIKFIMVLFSLVEKLYAKSIDFFEKRAQPKSLPEPQINEAKSGYRNFEMN